MSSMGTISPNWNDEHYRAQMVSARYAASNPNGYTFSTPTTPVTTHQYTTTQPTSSVSAPVIGQTRTTVSPYPPAQPPPSQRDVEVSEQWYGSKSVSYGLMFCGGALALIAIVMLALLGFFHLSTTGLTGAEATQLNTVKWWLLGIFVVMLFIGIILIAAGAMMHPKTPEVLRSPMSGSVGDKVQKVGSHRATSIGIGVVGIVILLTGLGLFAFAFIWHLSTNSTPLPTASQNRLRDYKWILVIIGGVMFIIGAIVALVGFMMASRAKQELEETRDKVTTANYNNLATPPVPRPSVSITRHTGPGMYYPPQQI